MSIANVAKRAGVSTATVCRVLRQSGQVRPETASQVLEAVRQVGYVPPPRRTVSRRRGERRDGKLGTWAGRIAVVTLGGVHRYWMAVPAMASFIASVTAVASELDIDVMLDEMPSPEEPGRLIRRGEIGGAILLVHSDLARTDGGRAALRSLAGRLPVVWAMGAQVGPLVVDHISPDNLGIGHLAASYLMGKGCRRCAMVVRTPEWAFIRERAAGFAGSLFDAGATFRIYLVSDNDRDGAVFPGNVHVVRSMEEAAAAMAASSDRPQGIFTATDAHMAELHPKLIGAGFRPGSDLQLVSCDNDRAALSLLDPKPATIDLNTAEIASRAIRRLRMRMRNLHEPPVSMQVPPVLIEPEQIAANR